MVNTLLVAFSKWHDFSIIKANIHNAIQTGKLTGGIHARKVLYLHPVRYEN